jgi:hypothetical protein
METWTTVTIGDSPIPPEEGTSMPNPDRPGTCMEIVRVLGRDPLGGWEIECKEVPCVPLTDL